jgi:peptidoglycan hydrolase FlgJ
MGMTIDGSSAFNTAQAATDTSNTSKKLESKLNTNLDNATDDELMDVCKSFESYFIEQVYKEMKKTVPANEDESNQYTEYFGDMLYQKYAEDTTEKGSLGMAQMLYESMKRK